MKDSWLADIEVASQMFPIPCIIWESHWNVKAVWSVGVTLSFSWWTDRQASVASMRKTLKFRQITCLTGEVKGFSQWCGGKQEREVGCPTRNPPLSRFKYWPGAKRNFDLDRTTGTGTIIWVSVSHTVIKLVQYNEIHMKVPGKYWWQTELFPWVQLTVDEISFIVKGLSLLWNMSITLHVLSWVIFCIKAFKNAIIINLTYLTSYTCATEQWSWAHGDTDCAMTVWFLKRVGLSTSNTIALMKQWNLIV